MREITIAPDLSACIRTLARRKHERIVQQLLTPGAKDPEFEKNGDA